MYYTVNTDSLHFIISTVVIILLPEIMNSACSYFDLINNVMVPKVFMYITLIIHKLYNVTATHYIISWCKYFLVYFSFIVTIKVFTNTN